MTQLPTQLNMYNATVPALMRGLDNLKGLVEKAKAYAAERNINDEVMMGARLALDMLPFAAQIRICTDNAKGAAARLSGGTAPVFADDETTLDQLIERIGKAKTYLASVDPKTFEGTETKEIVLKFPNATLEFVGYSYVTGFLLPNYYFHMTTAYDILRHYGVKLGKSDYLGGE
jgi:uncharacterized protein